MSPDPGVRSGSGVLVAAALAVAATILSLQLFVPPIVGLADNRDYERVMGYAGFQHTSAVPAERHFSFLRSKYAVVDPGWFRGGYHSSETLLAFAARGVHLLFAGRALFDIRLMGAIHAVLFLLALAGLIRACRDLTLAARIVAAASPWRDDRRPTFVATITCLRLRRVFIQRPMIVSDSPPACPGTQAE